MGEGWEEGNPKEEKPFRITATRGVWLTLTGFPAEVQACRLGRVTADTEPGSITNTQGVEYRLKTEGKSGQRALNKTF